MDEKDKDLKKGSEQEEQPDEDGQSSKKEGGEESEEDTSKKSSQESEDDSEDDDEEEDVDTLKARLKKAESDRDNYKRGMLEAKSKKRSLGEKEDDEEEDEDIDDKVGKEWDDDSKKFQKETLTKAQEIARAETAKVQKQQEKKNEQAAIKKVLKDYPEYADDDNWKVLVGYYTPRNGKEDSDGIIEDLSDAIVLADKKLGIDRTVEKSDDKGNQKKLADMTALNKSNTNRPGKSKDKKPEGAIRMASKFRNDPEKVAKEDDSLSATIKL